MGQAPNCPLGHNWDRHRVAQNDSFRVDLSTLKQTESPNAEVTLYYLLIFLTFCTTLILTPNTLAICFCDTPLIFFICAIISSLSFL